MYENTKQDTLAKTGDAAAVELGLNKETLRDLDPPASDDVYGGFIMQDPIIVPTGFIMKDSIIVKTSTR